MVLTAAQVTTFYEDAAQMAIPHATLIQLQSKGIDTVEDISDSDKDTLTQVADNLRKPGGMIPNPDHGALAGATIPTPPFVFGAKSQQRMLAASEMTRFYHRFGRTCTAANIVWNPVIGNFQEKWKALAARRIVEETEVPNITKSLPVIRWTEAFDDYLHQTIGAGTIPFAFVSREVVDISAPAPEFATGRPHSEIHGSVEAELILQASHTHLLYRNDNSKIYYKLDEATRGTSYAIPIKPFQRRKDGRGAWTSLTRQYASDDKWQFEIKRQDDLLHTRVWKGQRNFTLEWFIVQHCNAYVSMEVCATHVPYQLPNEFTRVGFLMDTIQCNDAGLQAEMANICSDDGATGKRNNFQTTALYLLTYNPVAHKRTSGTKRTVTEISSANAELSAFGSKLSVGPPGVPLRYHTTEEYENLNEDERVDLL